MKTTALHGNNFSLVMHLQIMRDFHQNFNLEVCLLLIFHNDCDKGERGWVWWLFRSYFLLELIDPDIDKKFIIDKFFFPSRTVCEKVDFIKRDWMQMNPRQVAVKWIFMSYFHLANIIARQVCSDEKSNAVFHSSWFHFET